MKLEYENLLNYKHSIPLKTSFYCHPHGGYTRIAPLLSAQRLLRSGFDKKFMGLRAEILFGRLGTIPEAGLEKLQTKINPAIIVFRREEQKSVLEDEEAASGTVTYAHTHTYRDRLRGISLKILFEFHY